MKSNSVSFPPALAETIQKSGVIAVIVIDEPSDVPPLADALLSGGLNAIELTLRTPSALESLSAFKKHAPQMSVGAGTVLTPQQLLQARDAGADFAVAPGCNPRVLAAAAEAGVPFAPGIATPSDIEAALEFGCRLLKFFPAEPSGGLAYLKNMTAPYAHLGLRYIPLGGISSATAAAWLADPLIAALGGSWIAPRALIQARDWAAIKQRAQEVAAIIRDTR
ncbi:2-dehydro-3-deoxyphosphogluconate aldolase/(4S)-4-hydroxy-2-oxoglutarate aldolase [Ereboglobus sp. PH5-5]|uniref:bifunctional 4-hydroxy-2-oxoglutarate aldolase/2-dehydro-3-deoxy-phosphogluconate aldolase n=1 Tax=Ereboglobus sp. PH5-5 TaxID=2940529 RepID=UPI0024062F0F|nr:bifunctional 4-hydroxy-2-oxoglutarate aldolase/2-dehydro-3-deoxy-phosphogluconate aldolase [Ereboglobus sp. PH5-5]MDF9834223.1 2-dehydro-3-deoxyphosphogluconate aldolase/(4S)-4-hydroxy-2-oxoglutarate aldolase [Ereboglobus sp. PH5-5]